MKLRPLLVVCLAALFVSMAAQGQGFKFTNEDSLRSRPRLTARAGCNRCWLAGGTGEALHALSCALDCNLHSVGRIGG